MVVIYVVVVVLGRPRRQFEVRVVGLEVVAEAAQAEAGARALVPGVGLPRVLDRAGRGRSSCRRRRHFGEAGRLALGALNERVVAGDRLVREALPSIRGPRQDRGARYLLVEADLAPVEAPLPVVALQSWRPLL